MKIVIKSVYAFLKSNVKDVVIVGIILTLGIDNHLLRTNLQIHNKNLIEVHQSSVDYLKYKIEKEKDKASWGEEVDWESIREYKESIKELEAKIEKLN